jgi:PHD/YefM family antitoxin component YafN of YafNO toxin-antitoxin module
MNAIVPISRFNKGEANKIFEEVNADGVKVAVKNNIPACILITPERYEEMLETIENYNLLLSAEERMKTAEQSDYISQDQLLKDLNIDPEELKNVDVEIG